MSADLAQFMVQCRTRVEAALNTNLPLNDDTTRLHDAMRYSLLSGGKRVRPLLVYASALAIDPSLSSARADALDGAACALEAMHAYSLVHDDLPAMDDDALRRGQATCHIAFGEANAILAGDALQALAFEILSYLPQTTAETRIALIQILSRASGAQGMVLGQAIDLAATDTHPSLQQLETMHSYKTGALIRASVALGARVCEASAKQLQALDSYAKAIGLAFQVQDDILDVTVDTATLGKQQGADVARNKPTYVSLLGLDAARQKAQDLHRQALAALADFGPTADYLRLISGYIVERSH